MIRECESREPGRGGGELRSAWAGEDARPHTGTQCPSTAAPRHLLLRWLKFNFVGALGIGVQLAALAVLKSVLHLDYLVATALAVEVAVLHNFLWHERFTWADRVHIAWRASLRRLAHFNLTTGAVSILGNLFFMRWLVGDLHLPYLAANAVSIALCSLANFLVADLFVFRPAADLRP
jgi:putative flippase GtrA